MSIPTESIDGDMTTDQDQGKNSTMNSTTPSYASYDLVAQNANEMGDAADTLCGQNDKIKPNSDKEAMADQQEEEEQTKADQTEHLREKITQIELELMGMKQWKAELLAKIEELGRKQKADQQKEDCAKIDEHLREKIKQIELELKDMKQQNVDQKEHRAKIDEVKTFKFSEKWIEELGRKQKADQQKEDCAKIDEQLCIVDLQKTVATVREAQNRWSVSTSPMSLTISAAGMIVQLDKLGPYSAFAALPIPEKDSGIFYYEVTILEVAGGVRIGLAPTQMTKNTWVGRYKGTYAIDNRNKIWGHAIAGCRHGSRDGRPYIGGTPSFYVGDVVGCGVNLATRQIMYTTNGCPLDTTGLFVDSAAELSDLFPCVSLFFPGTKIEANFGPNFEWKF